MGGKQYFFFVVCSARALSSGCKSRVSPNSGNYIAKGKGVHREVESERSRRQTSGRRMRNRMYGGVRCRKTKV